MTFFRKGTPMRRWLKLLAVIAVTLAVCPVWAQDESDEALWSNITLSGVDWTVTIDPSTLGVTARFKDGETIVLSEPQAEVDGAEAVIGNQTHVECVLPGRGLAFEAELRTRRLMMRFIPDRPGEITWPIVPAHEQLKAYILPRFEGVYAPADDAEWMAYLVERSPMDTTADLSMPFIGLDLGGQTLTYIFGNMFDNRVDFTKGNGAAADVSVTHKFMPNWDTWEYTVIVELGDGSPITPAKAYRDYLIERGEFVTMAEKIKANPKAERLLGAPHAYLWDSGLFSHLDATDWKGFAGRLIAEGEADQDTLGKRLWSSFNDETRDAAVQITQEQWPHKYIKALVAAGVSEYLVDQIESESGGVSREALLDGFCEHFDGLVRDHHDWGGGISTKMLDLLPEAGIDRMLLCMGDLTGAHHKTQVPRAAYEAGYLFGPYDSYHSIHRPDAHPDTTWETAQFGWELYNTGGVVNQDGSMNAGFKKIGYHLNTSTAWPFVEARVNDYMARVPHSAVFVDCDAYGQFFDDYSTDHPATKQQDMLQRLSRLDWLNKWHGLIVGSEGGSAYATGVIHFAHGMMTPVIGWGDPDLKDRNSPYYKGAYWPPDGPATFTKQVPLKPSYKKYFYDARFRLPLYQAVFHDSTITTHHWGNASLKFKDQVATVALLEQLYNIPPLYHLNLEEWKKHREHITAHHAFQAPLHRELALQPMTEFQWLTDDRLVQQTTFGDGTRLIANFDVAAREVDGAQLAAQSVIAIRPDGEISRYSPVSADE